MTLAKIAYRNEAAIYLMRLNGSPYIFIRCTIAVKNYRHLCVIVVHIVY